MKEIINNPLFWILITLGVFQIGVYISKKTKFPLFNPILIALSLIIGILVVFDIDYEIYNSGGQIINIFLGPATVVLAVPLYKQLDLLKKNFVAILTGLIVGATSSILSVIILGNLLSLDIELITSLIPKSVTTPIGVEVSKILGGIPSITIVSIVITGVVGAIIAPTLNKILRIKSSIAIGVGIGSAAHALGTTKAFEMGEAEGAMSSLSIGVAGLITVFIAPYIFAISMKILSL